MREKVIVTFFLIYRKNFARAEVAPHCNYDTSRCGEPGEAMPNRLYYGDNLYVLRESIADESVDLVYLDPP